MNVWFSQTVVQDLGWTLVHFLWEGLAIAALLAVMLRVMRKSTAQARYLSGCAAMLLMAVAPMLTFQLVTVRDESPALAGLETAAVTQPPVQVAPRPSVTKPAIVVTATPVAHEAGAVLRVERIFPWVVAGWLAGVVALSVRLLAGWWQVRRLKGVAAQTLGGHLQEKMTELARRLGVERPLRLLESALVEVPTVIGWLRPVILLPASCLTGLSASQLEAILAHELAHIRRHDYLVNLLQSAVETLLFYHPAVWWVSRRVREERENCCDDLAVGVCGDRVGYARALATLEELRPAPAQLALAATGAPLLQRVRRLLGQTERNAGRPAWPVAGIIALLLAAVLAAGMREQRLAAAESVASGLAESSIRPSGNNGKIGESSMQALSMSEKQIVEELNAIEYLEPKSSELQTDPHAARIIALGRKTAMVLCDKIHDTNDSKHAYFFQYKIGDLANVLLEEIYNQHPSQGLISRKPPVDPKGGYSYQDYVALVASASGREELRAEWIKVIAEAERKQSVVPRSAMDAPTPNPEAPARAAVENSWTNHPAAIPDPFLERAIITNQSGMNSWTVDGQNQLNQQWFWYRVGATNSTNAQTAVDAPVRGEPGAQADSDRNFPQGLRNESNAPALATMTGILTDQQFRPTTTALDQRDGVEVPSSSEVTTGKGAQDSPAYQTNAVEIAEQVQKGRFFLEEGKVNEAEAVLKQALIGDPSNIAAQHYLELVKERRTAYAADPRELAAHKALVQVESEWDLEQRSRQQTPKPNAYARREDVTTGKGRQAIISKLNSIRLEKVNFPEISLREVLANLKQISKTRDPNSQGINFFTDRQEGKPDLGEVKVKVELDNVRLLDVLDAMVRTANHPIKYTFLDYGVVFSEGTNEPVALEIRTFHVDPKTFQQSLQSVVGIAFGGAGSNTGSGTLVPQVQVTGSVGGIRGTGSNIQFVTGSTNSTDQFSGLIRNFFAAAGVDLSTNAGKTVIWNERKGALTVRATAQDLDLIEAAVQILNQPPPQLNIKVKFLELPMGTNGAADAKALFDTLMKAGMVTQFTGPFTNGVPAAVTIAESLKAGKFTGTLTDPQYRAVLKELEQRGGAVSLMAPEITTENGRQAQIQAPTINVTLPAPLPTTTLGGGRVAGPNAVQSGQAPASAVFTAMGSAPATMYTPRSATPIVMTSNGVSQPLSFGTTLDVIPYISADEFSVQMTLIPSVTEFIGYDDPGQFVPQAALPTGQTLTSVLPLPKFRVRQVITNAVVWDGQTVVIGGLITDSVSKVKDEVPMIGDLPVVGRFFRSESFTKTKKNLLIFITPTIINPDGARVHAEEEMPFSKAATPKGKN